MADAVVIGGGPVGLSTALLLADRGLDVTLLDRDGPAPSSVADAWEAWERKSVTQFRLVHFLQPGGRITIEEHLPSVYREMQAAGLVTYNSVASLAAHLPGGSPDEDFSRFETLTTCRRPVLDYAFVAAARAHPRIELRNASPVAGLLTGPSVIDGVLHVTGVVTESGESITADVVVDAAGRRTPVPRLLEEAGGVRPAEEVEEYGFVYNTRYYRSAEPPEVLAPPLSPVDSISVLSIPGDDGYSSITLYHSPEDKLMRKIRDPEVFDRVVRSLPLHAHWADGEPAGEIRTMTSTANTARAFVVEGAPCATGLVPIGDAWGFTNPSLGRGITLGIKHAVALAPAIAEHLDDPAALATAWDTETKGEPTAWHDSTVDFDKIRGPEVEAFRLGLPDPHDPNDVGITMAKAFASASNYDREVLQWAGEVGSCLALPSEVVGRPGVFEKVIEVSMANPVYRTPGPTRAELEALLV